jgi:hypothetical protein
MVIVPKDVPKESYLAIAHMPTLLNHQWHAAIQKYTVPAMHPHPCRHADMQTAHADTHATFYATARYASCYMGVP